MQHFRVRIRYLFCALALTATMCAQAQGNCTLTLLKDTPLRVIRGVSVFVGIEGMRLRQGDVLETGPAVSAQAQVECSGGAIVELGPASQANLYSQSETSAEVLLLTGWLKGETTAGNHRYISRLLAVATKGGNVLLHNNDDAADVFVERGSANVDSGAGTSIASAKDRIFFTRRTGKAVVATDRPSPEFISQMPVSFRDALPSRLSRFAGTTAPTPKREHDVSYTEIERLLTLPPGWRKGLVERFKPRLEDRSFRAAIESHIAALPEWKPVLYPDNQNPSN
jgi:hypothetical protein